MHTFLRLVLFLVLIATGIGLATTVVVNSEPTSSRSPVQMVQGLIESTACAMKSDVPSDDTSSDVQAQKETVAKNPAAETAPAPAASASRAVTNTEHLGHQRIAPAPTAMALPSTVTAYLPPPAVASPFAMMPIAPAPYMAPYYPMVANQYAPGPTPAPINNFRPTPDILPPPPREPMQPPEMPAAPPVDAGPSSEPESQPELSGILRDEGDDSLIINIQDSDIREVLELLSEQGNLNILASTNVTGKVSASLSGVDVLTALKAILKSTGFAIRHEDSFIYVGTQEDFQQMDQANNVLGTRIYRPNYVTAIELQTLIVPMLTEGKGKSTVSSASEIDIPSDGVKTGGNNFAGNEVLLVHDYEAVLQQVDHVVEEVDQRPLQVVIEAVILTVALDDSIAIGVNFEMLRDNDNMRIISGSPLDNLADMSLDKSGLRIGFLDRSLSVLVEALEEVGDTNVVASPRLLCVNKQRAEIHVGEQLGYLSTTVTETAATQTVEFLEVGTQLRLRPFISSDGMIRMEIHPELSTGAVETKDGVTLPSKEVAQVTSNVMCQDGRTIVIGGLFQEGLWSDSKQIPLLGSLPGIGVLFRQKQEKIKRDEIIVVITPRIICEPAAYAEGADAACSVADRIQVFEDKMSPIGTRHYGRRYQRMAQAAWAAGDCWSALRYVNLALHFDRQNPDALRLRREIVTVLPEGDNNIHRRLRDGLAPWGHPHTEYSRQGWPWRAPTPAPINEEIILEMEEVPVEEVEPIDPPVIEPVPTPEPEPVELLPSLE